MPNQANLNVFVGLSGGVDSSVAALLLKNQGFNVTGIHMQNWEASSDDPYCSANQDLKDAHDIANKLAIPFKVVNFKDLYWQHVFTHFLDEYAKGRTPNPDILCNTKIKFSAFLDHARANGADLIATGHYARITKQPIRLLRGLDENKDQSYFLYGLEERQLQASLFPIGALKKEEVRAMAKKAGFKNHAKKDSTGICFIGERKFKEFLGEYLLATPGDIITCDGKILGRHEGLMFYTLGQRQGLKIGGRKDAREAPWYVVKKDCKKNILFVAQESNHPLLMSSSIQCGKVHWINCHFEKITCTAKIRYRQKDQPCSVERIDDDMYKVTFLEPQRAAAPGQSVVFYNKEECLGGGVIDRIEQ